MAGAASAVFGFLQTGAAALTGLLVGQLYDDSLRPTAFTMLGTVAVACAGLLLLHLTRDAPPEIDHATT
jgi:urea transporter